MRNKRWRALAALTAVAALTLSACGGGTGDDGTDGTDGTTDGSEAPAAAEPEFNAALEEVYNPSDKKGGVIKMAHSSDWDTLDPGETYYGFSWNFARLYGRSLLTFRAAPGDASNELVPDLAEDLGEASDGGKTWTYKIREGVKFQDGTEVTAADVKYAVLRSTDKETFPNGPAYFEQFLDLPEGYAGPYKTPDMNTDSAIEWVTNTTVEPISCQIWSSSLFSRSRVISSRAPNGSSIRRSAGENESARAIETRCCIPPESCQGWCFAKPPSSTSSSISRTRSSRRRRSQPASSSGSEMLRATVRQS